MKKCKFFVESDENGKYLHGRCSLADNSKEALLIIKQCKHSRKPEFCRDYVPADLKKD